MTSINLCISMKYLKEKEYSMHCRYEFYDNHEVDLLRLDTSCVIRFKEAPAIEHGSIE